MLVEKRDQMQDEAHGMLDRAAAEKRDLTVSENARFEQITADLRELKARSEKTAELADTNEKIATNLRALTDQPRTLARPHAGGSIDPEVNELFRRSIQTRSMAPIEIGMPTVNERRSFYQPGVEARGLATSSNIEGVSFYGTLVRNLTANSAVLSAGATLINSDSGEPLRIPKSTASSVATIVPEGGQIPESDPSLGSVVLSAYKYGFLVQVTRELADDSGFDLAGYLALQAGIALGNGAGIDFVSGTGGGVKPTGILSGAVLGVTGATGVGGAPSADNLIDLLHSVVPAYLLRPSAGWLMNESTLAAVRKLKASGTGEYLFATTPPHAGAIGTLLGFPVYADPNMPNIGLGKSSILFGDFSAYFVRSVGAIRFEPSIDFAFDHDLVTYRALWRCDGAPVDTSGAFKSFVGGAS